jgi:hypothetical protein
MRGLTTIREIARAWSAAGHGPLCASIELAVGSRRAGGLDVRFAAARERPRRLERRAAAGFAATAARLPEELRPWLAVETGEVRARLCGRGEERVLLARRYQMASCRGVVLGMRGRAGGGPFAPPWTGTLPARDLPPDLPLVLAPSAVLALVSYALEVTGGHIAAQSAAMPPQLTVLDTAASPYPPQHHPFAGNGAPSPDRQLLAGGRWCARREHASERVDPLFFLLTRPDRALRPLAAATHFNRRNLAVECGRAAPRPPRSVVVDSWRVRVGPRAGAVPFHAHLTCAMADGARLAATEPVALDLDPWQVLARVLGGCGRSAPAIDEDPIEGDNYGRAPELVTDLTLADLHAAGKPA